VSSAPQSRAGHVRRNALTAFSLALALMLTSALSVDQARAATQVRPSVGASTSSSVVLTGDRVVVSGRVSRVVARSPLRLQRWTSHRWATLRTGRPVASGAYRFTFSSTVAGAWRLRVVSGSGHRAVASRLLSLRVLACTPGAPPADGAAAWFTRPGLPGLNPIADRLSRLFCAAAPYSTIDISMYYIRAFGRQPDVDPMLTSLRRVVRYHHVKVRVLLEGRLHAPGMSMRSSLDPLRSFATVILCHNGCHNDRPQADPGRGIMHHKFITVSDMSWSPGKDPAVVESSANWSQSQLGSLWQSAVLLYNDDELYREFHVQFETLATCAVDCSGWSRRQQQLGLSSDAYGLTNVRGLWRDVTRTERRAAPGSGRGVVFSPWTGRDPLAAALRGYTCNAAHHTVLLDHMFITGRRQAVIDALVGLAQRGCDVQVILGELTGSPLADGVRKVRDSGLTVGCVPRVHDKVVLVDAVRSATGSVDQSVWMGSQSLGGRALLDNDEALLRVSTADATGRARVANASLFSRFRSDWHRLDEHRKAC
jgi:hypothetical protein